MDQWGSDVTTAQGRQQVDYENLTEFQEAQARLNKETKETYDTDFEIQKGSLFTPSLVPESVRKNEAERLGVEYTPNVSAYDAYKPSDPVVHSNIQKLSDHRVNLAEQLNALQDQYNAAIRSEAGEPLYEDDDRYNGQSENLLKQINAFKGDLVKTNNQISKAREDDPYIGMTDEERVASMAQERVYDQYAKEGGKLVEAIGFDVEKNRFNEMNWATSEDKKEAANELEEEFVDYTKLVENAGKTNQELLKDYLYKKYHPELKNIISHYDNISRQPWMDEFAEAEDDSYGGGSKEIKKKVLQYAMLYTMAEKGVDPMKAFGTGKSGLEQTGQLLKQPFSGLYSGLLETGASIIPGVDAPISKNVIELELNDNKSLGNAIKAANRGSGVSLSDDLKESIENYTIADAAAPSIKSTFNILPKFMATEALVASGTGVLSGAGALQRSASFINRLDRIRQASKLPKSTRFMANALLKSGEIAATGAKYDLMGELFDEEEGDFASGAAGKTGVIALEGIIDVGKNYISRIFPASKPFLDSMSNKQWAQFATKMIGGGAGELVEETAQGVTQAGGWDNFLKTIEKDEDKWAYLISTLGMGMLMGGSDSDMAQWAKSEMEAMDADRMAKDTGLDKIADELNQAISERTLSEQINQAGVVSEEDIQSLPPEMDVKSGNVGAPEKVTENITKEETTPDVKEKTGEPEKTQGVEEDVSVDKEVESTPKVEEKVEEEVAETNIKVEDKPTEKKSEQKVEPKPKEEKVSKKETPTVAKKAQVDKEVVAKDTTTAPVESKKEGVKPAVDKTKSEVIDDIKEKKSKAKEEYKGKIKELKKKHKNSDKTSMEKAEDILNLQTKLAKEIEQYDSEIKKVKASAPAQVKKTSRPSFSMPKEVSDKLNDQVINSKEITSVDIESVKKDIPKQYHKDFDREYERKIVSEMAKAGKKAMPKQSGGLYQIQFGKMILDALPRNVRKLDYWKENLLTPRGGLPKDVFKSKVKRDGEANAIIKKAEYNADELRKAVKKVYPKKITRDQLENINESLYNENKRQELPPEIRIPIEKMRIHIDQLSKRLVDIGAVEGKMAIAIEEGLGTYLNRSYEIHDNPDFVKQISEEQKDLVKDWIGRNYEGVDADVFLADLEDKQTLGHTMEDFIFKGKLGGKDLKSLKKRKDVPEVIRAYMGEYKDPFVNYMKTIRNIANISTNHEFLSEVKKEGMGKIFYEPKDPNRPSEFSRTMAAESNKVMSPLNGLKTTPAIAEAFEKFDKAEVNPKWIASLMKLNGMAKFGKTILNPMTHARNLTGNIGFLIANGHLDVTKAPESFKILRQKTDISKEKYTELVKLGVVEDDVQSGTLRDLLEDAHKRVFDDKGGLNIDGIKNIGSGSLKKVVKLYEAEDSIFKIYAYNNELSRYKKAYKENPKYVDPNTGEPTMDLKRLVADNIRNTYPTYSLISQGVKKLRRFPLLASFPSFVYEVYRTTVNTVRLALKELRNPETKWIGVKRMGGFLTSMTIGTMISQLSKYLLGIDEDDDDAVRQYAADWDRNGTLVYLDDIKDGKTNYINLSYTDPHAFLANAINAFTNPAGDQSRLGAVAHVLGDAFISEDMMTSRLIDIGRNVKKGTNQQVYNLDDNAAQIAKDMYDHLSTVSEPGFIRMMMRILKSGETDPYGRVYDAGDEIISTLTGFRKVKVNAAKGYPMKLSATNKRISDNLSDYNRTFYSKASDMTDEKKDKEYDKAQSRVEKAIEDAREDYLSAMRLGVPENELNRMLNKSRLPKQFKKAIKSGDPFVLKKKH